MNLSKPLPSSIALFYFEYLIVVHHSERLLTQHVCVRACACVCVCVRVQSISKREVAGSIPDDYGRTRLSSLSHSPSSSFILLGGYQQPVYAGVRGVVCVSKKKKE